MRKQVTPHDGEWKGQEGARPIRSTQPARATAPTSSNTRGESNSHTGPGEAKIAAQQTVPMDHVFSIEWRREIRNPGR
jgi:hypothetical protein